MALLATVVVLVCFVASLLPFLLPGAVIGLLGNVLNDALGDPLWAVAAGRAGHPGHERGGRARPHAEGRARALRAAAADPALAPAQVADASGVRRTPPGAIRLPRTSRSTPATKKPTVR